MNGFRRMCRFCMKAVYDNKFDVVEQVIRQMLDALLLKLSLDDNEDTTVMCYECTTKLQNAVDFKTTCLKTESKISADNVKLEKSELDENIDVKLIEIARVQKVCQFCKKVIEDESYTCLQEKKEYVFLVDMVQKYIPELHLCVTEELATCKTCLDSLQELLSFITDCLETEERIKKCDSSCDFNIVKLEKKFDCSAEAASVKDETEYSETLKVDFLEVNIKKEEVENKLGQNDHESFQDTIETHWILENIRKGQNQDLSSVIKCDKCSYVTKRRMNLKRHYLTHQDFVSEVYKCKLCSFQTKHKISLKRHRLTHQDTLETSFFKCEICSHETKYKSSLKKHMLTHEESSVIFKCEFCSFETKHRGSLKRHCLAHQDFPEVSVYKCESCSYESKSKDNLKKHILTHQDVSQSTMYKCEQCLYESKRRSNLSKHMRIHKKLSEVTVYKCDKCSFKTIHKISLKHHCLTHQELSEVTIYKCDFCSFETKHKMNLKRHCMTHKDFPKVTVYKCESCPYSVFRKDTLRRHMLMSHKSSTVIE